MAATNTSPIQKYYSHAVREGYPLSKTKISSDPAQRANGVMLDTLIYRQRLNDPNTDKNCATVSILYRDANQKKFRINFHNISFGDKTNGINHGERRAWEAAKKWYEQQKVPKPTIINIDIASDRSPCVEQTYQNPCGPFFSIGGGATVGNSAQTLVFVPGRDYIFYSGHEDELARDIQRALQELDQSLVVRPITPPPLQVPSLNDFPSLPGTTTTTTSSVSQNLPTGSIPSSQSNIGSTLASVQQAYTQMSISVTPSLPTKSPTSAWSQPLIKKLAPIPSSPSTVVPTPTSGGASQISTPVSNPNLSSSSTPSSVSTTPSKKKKNKKK